MAWWIGRCGARIAVIFQPDEVVTLVGKLLMGASSYAHSGAPWDVSSFLSAMASESNIESEPTPSAAIDSSV